MVVMILWLSFIFFFMKVRKEEIRLFKKKKNVLMKLLP